MIRISATDRQAQGWSLEDSVGFASQCENRGVDVVDCSSGTGSSADAAPHYQVLFARAIRARTGIRTMAIGLITAAHGAQSIIADECADLVGLARGALEDPNWPVHARHVVGGEGDPYELWPIQIGFVIRNKDRELRQRSFCNQPSD